MKTVRFHHAALREARGATLWYALRNPQAAQRFLDELQAAYSNAARTPLRYPDYLHGTRRVLLNRFPYLLVYLDWQDEIYIVAVARAKRRPGYWRRRV